MFVVLLSIYLTFCVLVAWSARNVAIGFWGVLILSIFLTPLLTAILAVIFSPQSKKKKKKKKKEAYDWEEEY